MRVSVLRLGGSLQLKCGRPDSLEPPYNIRERINDFLCISRRRRATLQAVRLTAPKPLWQRVNRAEPPPAASLKPESLRTPKVAVADLGCGACTAHACARRGILHHGRLNIAIPLALRVNENFRSAARRLHSRPAPSFRNCRCSTGII